MAKIPNPPLVCLIILNYNGKRHLMDCLPSVMQVDYSNLEIVVVDNNSSDGSQDFIKSGFPKINLIQNKRNLGFQRASNIGIEYALKKGADYIALLNNDTAVNPSWIRELVKVAEADPIAAICGSKILAWDKKTIEYSGTVFHRAQAGGGYTDELDQGQYEAVRDAAYACGAAMLIRAEAVKKIGGFDPHFFAYNDDVDLGIRAWICGYKVVYAPTSVVYHKRSATWNEEFRTYMGMRNALTTILKNYEIKTLLETAKANIKIHFFAKKNYMIKSLVYNLFILPRTLWKRSQVQKKRKISDREMFKKFAYQP